MPSRAEGAVLIVDLLRYSNSMRILWSWKAARELSARVTA